MNKNMNNFNQINKKVIILIKLIKIKAQFK